MKLVRAFGRENVCLEASLVSNEWKLLIGHSLF